MQGEYDENDISGQKRLFVFGTEFEENINPPDTETGVFYFSDISSGTPDFDGSDISVSIINGDDDFESDYRSSFYIGEHVPLSPPRLCNDNGRVIVTFTELPFTSNSEFTLIRNNVSGGQSDICGTALQDGGFAGREFTIEDSCAFQEGESYQYFLDFSTSGDVYRTWDLGIVTYQSVEDENHFDIGFELGSNYPNPFNPVTEVPYTIGVPGDYTLEVYNMLGKRVLRYEMRSVSVGYHNQTIDMLGFSSGVYIYQLSGESTCLKNNMLFVK
ncbi:MAG: T9SS type A sorting domain-containing protein [Candidatus Omnitrophota bacterium]